MTFKYRVSRIEWNPVGFLTIEFDFTGRAMSKRRRVSIWMICPSQRACPRVVALLMQNPGCAIEFTPAKCLTFGSPNIDNRSIRKAIRADLAIPRPRALRFTGNNCADTNG